MFIQDKGKRNCWVVMQKNNETNYNLDKMSKFSDVQQMIDLDKQMLSRQDKKWSKIHFKDQRDNDIKEQRIQKLKELGARFRGRESGSLDIIPGRHPSEPLEDKWAELRRKNR